ncbi:Urb2/Npa2 family-domain-containing protein [Scheffersomyces coipomensis]|uniref:Urb2/Npa2 family-domain-containing protein n=1 Tax=Scheffersomyces coipomensis TaxID=1788519 RepID=UPI00315DD25E
MPELNSAESVTKFLRSKNGSYKEIIETANKLLDSEFDIYLPNKDIFILELLCDRLNDFNTPAFKQWKYNKESWHLLIKIWNDLGEKESDRSIRNRIIHRLRLIEIIIATLDTDIDDTFIDTIIDFINIVKRDYYIDAEESLLIDFLSKYTIRLSKLPTYKQSQALAWTQSVKDVINSPKSSLNYAPTRKSYTKFIHDAIPSILNFLVVCEFSEIKDVYEDIVRKSIFNSTFKTDLVKQIKPILSTLSKESVIVLFKLSVENTSNKDFQLCEDLFTAIVEVPHFIKLTVEFLSIIEFYNKTVSTNFVKSLYTEEINSTSVINWKLIVYLLRLDIELALENANYISQQTKVMKDLEVVNEIGKCLLDAHVKSRDLIKFIMEIWPEMIRSNRFYESNQFVSEVSKTIDDLSASHLINLVTSLYKIEDRNSLQPLLTSVIKGVLSGSVAKQGQLKDTLLSHAEIINTDLAIYWQLRYYLLCIYGNDFITDLKKFKKKDSKYYFDFIFRSIEVSGNMDIIKGEEKQVLKAIKSDKESILLCIKRWLIIIETCFNETQLHAFLDIVFKALEPSEIISCFEQYGDFIFERTTFVSALIKYLNSEVKTSPKISKIVQYVPLQAIDRRQRVSLIDNVFDIIVSTKANTSVTEYFTTLEYLLSQPSFGSQIEKEHERIFEILSVKGADKNQSVVNIIKNIWIHHLTQLSHDDSKTYVTGMLKKLNTYFSSKKVASNINIPQYEVAYLILSNSQGKRIDDETIHSVQTLKLNVLKSSGSRITSIISGKNLDLDNINWLLKSFLLVNANDQVDYLSLIKKTGDSIKNTDTSAVANDIRRVCFTLIAKNLEVKGVEDVFYVLALFLSLRSHFDLDLTNEISDYVKEISQQDGDILTTVFSYVLISTAEADSTYIGACVTLLGALIKSLNKDITDHHRLFITAISTIISKAEIISLQSSLDFLSIVREALGDKVWLFSQSALEITVTFIDKCCLLSSISSSDLSVDLYILATQAFSHILLYHRYKLTSRHHIIISSCSYFLESLSNKRKESPISSSKLAARSYARLLENLCEPSKTSLSIKDKTNLTSSSVLAKRVLRKHLPILVVNYIFFNLKYNFESSINDEIMPGIYSAFDVLSQEEIRLISSSLDIPGKTFLRSLYSNYKDHGKWKDI